MGSRAATILLVAGAAAGMLALLAALGPPMLQAAVPLLALLPPGAFLLFAAGFATAAPLQAAAALAAFAIGRLTPAHPRAALLATSLAWAASLAWELAALGPATVVATGAEFLLGRLVGLAAAAALSVAACGAGRRRSGAPALPEP